MGGLFFGSARAPISIFPLGGKRPSRLPSTLNSYGEEYLPAMKCVEGFALTYPRS